MDYGKTLPLPPELASQLDPMVSAYLAEVRQLLPKLPKDLRFGWDNNRLFLDKSTSGFAVHPKLIVLAFRLDFEDRQTQIEDLRGRVYHECFHIAQGWSGYENLLRKISALDEAIMEGAALVFERTYTNSTPLFTAYENDEVMRDWLKEVKALEEDYDVSAYKFWHQATRREFILYKLGAWIIDNALKNKPKLKIEDLARKSPSKILKLAKL